MSSGTSTSTASTRPSTRMMSGSLRAGAEGKDQGNTSSSLKPWQFFLLAGMLAATAAVVVATGQSMASIVMLSVTVVATSLVGVAAYRTFLPFVSPDAVRAPEKIEGHARAMLEREKMLVLRAIKDLEFDHAMGKIAQADFDEMSGRLRSRAVGLLQQLDGVGAHRERIERELAERLAKMPAPRSKAPVVRPALTDTCATCGTTNDADAKFCKQCGARFEGHDAARA